MGLKQSKARELSRKEKQLNSIQEAKAREQDNESKQTYESLIEILKRQSTQMYNISITRNKFLNSSLQTIPNSKQKEIYYVLSIGLSTPQINKKRYCYIQNKKKPATMLLQVCAYKYMNLTFLNVFECNIHSIEPLAYLFAPKLKTLCMQYNHISSIKPIAKCSFNQIYIIDLSQNQIPLISLSHFTRCLFSMILRIEFANSDQLIVAPDTHQIIQLLKINSEKLSYRAKYLFPKKPSFLIDKFYHRLGQFYFM